MGLEEALSMPIVEESRAGLVGGGSMGVHALGLLRLKALSFEKALSPLEGKPWLDTL